jgi:hypothetical protein
MFYNKNIFLKKIIFVWLDAGLKFGKRRHSLVFSLFKIYICSVWMDDGTDDRMDDATDGWMENFISSTMSFTL